MEYRRGRAAGTFPLGVAVLHPVRNCVPLPEGVYGLGLPDPEFTTKAALYFGHNHTISLPQGEE